MYAEIRTDRETAKTLPATQTQLLHMPSRDPPSQWTDPEYVSTVVGVLATGALIFYSSLTQSGPTVDEIAFVILTITVPTTVAYELARRFG